MTRLKKRIWTSFHQLTQLFNGTFIRKCLIGIYNGIIIGIYYGIYLEVMVLHTAL